MALEFANASLAKLKSTDVPGLAELRNRPGVELAILSDQEAWLRWRVGDTNTARLVFAFQASELFEFRNGHWHRLGCPLPSFGIPGDLPFRPLFHAILPGSILPLPVPSERAAPCEVRLVEDSRPREATAVLAPITACLRWADSVPNLLLEKYQAVRRSEHILVLGQPVPWLDGGQRFWGDKMLFPLGFSPKPFLPDAQFQAALMLERDDFAVFFPDRIEAISATVWASLSRAKLRWMVRTP